MRDLLFQPLTWGWLLLGWVGVCALRKGRRTEGFAALSLFTLLLVCGGTPFPAWCLGRLELPYARSPGTFPPAADAVVMLGGGHSASSWESTGLDANAAFDRALSAWQLIRHGVSTNLVLGGGGGWTRDGSQSDGGRLETWLRSSGENSASIRILPPSHTTADEAQGCRTLMAKQGWKRVILVTSAAHLPRALAAFQRAGIDAEPFGADFRGLDSLEHGGDGTVIPNPWTLQTTQVLLHELLGRVWYAVTGKGG